MEGNITKEVYKQEDLYATVYGMEDPFNKFMIFPSS